MKNIISLISVFLFTLIGVKGATVYTGMKITGSGYLTQGNSYYLSQVTFNVFSGATGFISDIRNPDPNHSQVWNLFITIPNGTGPINTGLYTTIVQYAGNPVSGMGLGLSGEGRSSSPIPGSFVNILQCDWVDGKIVGFAADILFLSTDYLHMGNKTVSKTEAAIRLNSPTDFTSSIPEPRLPLLSCGIILFLWKRSRQHK